MANFFTRIRNELIELNLFKTGLNDVEVVRQERWSTRLYVILLIIGLVILVIYTALSTQTVHFVVDDPSLETFETLQLQYAETLQCPCSQIAVEYGSFLQIQPNYHQICSSSFVTQEWIDASYAANVSNIWPMDVRTVISAHAQFLRSFCENAQQGISFVLIRTLSSPLVSAEALPVSLVRTQTNIEQGSILSAGQWQLRVLITFMRLTMASSHLMTGLGTNSFLYITSNDSSTANNGINSYQLNSNSTPCYCLSMDDCSMPGAIYPNNEMPTFGSFNLEAVGTGSIPIIGIQVGCFALESVLASTLECYYNSSCIELLVSNSERFPPLSSTLPSQFSRNTAIGTLLDQLMVENLTVSMSYADYYAECAPKTCTYSFNQRNNFLVVLTSIAALIGGLSSSLRLIVPLIIQIIIKIKRRIQSQNDDIRRVPVVWTGQRSALDKIKEKLSWLWLQLKMLNFFNSNSSNISRQHYERQTTRLYIVFVIIAFAILFFYTVITKQTTVYTVQNPSQETYEKLYAEYSDTIQCTCNNISIPYSTFITIQASYHQACSSSFISPAFLIQLGMIRTDIPIYPADFMLMSVDYFQWLTTFCSLSELVLVNELGAFQEQLFVNNKLLTNDTFQVQARQLADSFINDLQYYFSAGIKNMRQLLGFSQPISATFTITYQLPITTTSSGSQVRIEPANFFSDCSCLINPTTCSTDAAFYSYIPMNNSFYPVFNVSGILTACSSMESFLQSSLACWYSSECYDTVIQYWQNRTYSLSGVPSLLNDTIPSQYEPSTPLNVILGQVMVENWSIKISYNSYFSQCAPLYCTYSVTQRRDAIFLVTILLGLFGGLNIVLRLLTPLLVKLGKWLIRHGRTCHITYRNHLNEIPSQLAQFNLFYRPNQSSESTLRKEIHSTRLYIMLLMMSMLTLIFYYSFSQSITTITIENPTQEIYEKLQQSEGISFLQCPCSQVSISYGTFVQANTTLHEICSSSFIEQSWIQNIAGNGDWSNLTSTDFYGRGVVYFQGLHSLCYLYQENVTQDVSNFLSSTFISSQVLSEIQLINQVNNTVEQAKASSREDYSSFYEFARDIENANQLMTIYSANWVYASIKYDPNLIGLPIPLVPVSHGNCSCSVSSQCVEPVTLNGQIVPGFVLGCVPFESIFQSTLICFYNQTCIDQININHLPATPLTAPSDSDLSINRTIEELIDNAFDLEWYVDISYQNFFNACRPASCSYSVNQRRNVVQIIVTLLSFYGGLTVVLRFIVPYMIDFVYRTILKFRQLENNIHPQNDQRY